MLSPDSRPYTANVPSNSTILYPCKARQYWRKYIAQSSSLRPERWWRVLIERIRPNFYPWVLEIVPYPCISWAWGRGGWGGRRRNTSFLFWRHLKLFWVGQGSSCRCEVVCMSSQSWLLDRDEYTVGSKPLVWKIIGSLNIDCCSHAICWSKNYNLNKSNNLQFLELN